MRKQGTRLGKQRGAQENLWPKFILKSAPLRATSSAFPCCTCHTISNLLKIGGAATKMTGRNFFPASKNYFEPEILTNSSNVAKRAPEKNYRRQHGDFHSLPAPV